MCPKKFEGCNFWDTILHLQRTHQHLNGANGFFLAPLRCLMTPCKVLISIGTPQNTFLVMQGVIGHLLLLTANAGYSQDQKFECHVWSKIPCAFSLAHVSDQPIGELDSVRGQFWNILVLDWSQAFKGVVLLRVFIG